MNESCLIWLSHVSYEWVMFHMNESCPICMSHVSYAWVMSHMNEINLLHARCINVELILENMLQLPATREPWVFTRKSPIFSQKSPIFSQKRHSFSQKRPIFSRKRPIFSQKSPIFSRKSHIFSEHSPMFTLRMSSSRLLQKIRRTRTNGWFVCYFLSKEPSLKRALFSLERAPYTLKRALCSLWEYLPVGCYKKAGVYVRTVDVLAIFSRKSPIFSQKSPTFCRKSPIFSQIRPIFFWKRPVLTLRILTSWLL